MKAKQKQLRKELNKEMYEKWEEIKNALQEDIEEVRRALVTFKKEVKLNVKKDNLREFNRLLSTG